MPRLIRWSSIALMIMFALSSGCTLPPRHSAVGVSVGVTVPAYPRLVLVPGYPVYYAPGLSINLFFYDGLYWLFYADNWYVSTWYDGPWELVLPYYVPVYILSIPVRYYRQPPPYFSKWEPNAPPHWEENWGKEWLQRRDDMKLVVPRSAPAPAPLPNYQRNYSGERYPRQTESQDSIHKQNYRYDPRDEVTRQVIQRPGRRRPAQ